MISGQTYNQIQTILAAGYKHIVSNGESLFVIGENQTREIRFNGDAVSSIPSGYGSVVLHAFVVDNTAYYSYRYGAVFKLDIAAKSPHTQLIGFNS